MGALEFCGRLLLVLINLILLLVSLALIIFGFLVKYASDVFNAFTKKALDKITASASGALGTASLDTSNLDLGELFGGVATVLIVIGFILLAISFFGCCGAICGIKIMLAAYSTVLIIIVIAQVVFVIILFRYPNVLKNAVKQPLKTLLKNFKGLNGTNVESLGWNFIMQEFDCCGVENSDDFKNSDTEWFGKSDPAWKTPLACCKTLPSTNDLDCAKASGNDPSVNNYDKGCVEAMWNKLMSQNKTYTYLGVGAILGFQVLLIIFALVVCCKKDDNKVEPIQERQPKRNTRNEW